MAYEVPEQANLPLHGAPSLMVGVEVLVVSSAFWVVVLVDLGILVECTVLWVLVADLVVALDVLIDLLVALVDFLVVLVDFLVVTLLDPLSFSPETSPEMAFW